MEARVYKLKRALIAYNIASLMVFGLVLGTPLIALIAMLLSVFQNQSDLGIFPIAIVCLVLPSIALLAFALVSQGTNVVLSFFASIRITADGIEQKHWPYKHIHTRWSDVDRLEKFWLFYDALYVNAYEVLGTSLSLSALFRLFRPTQGYIILSGFEGWPNGEIANDIKLYAPRLFEARNQLNENQRQNAPKDEVISSENRLLAALAHASVFFSSIGIIIPIGIYIAQRNKSPFVAFQSLQAIVWQITAFIANGLLSACMTGAIFIPIFITVISKNENFLELLPSGIVVIAIAIGLLLGVVNLAFLFYSIIGTVRVYQGKDFRYPLIGNRIDPKHKPSKQI